jgi:cytochrome c peroxidase
MGRLDWHAELLPTLVTTTCRDEPRGACHAFAICKRYKPADPIDPPLLLVRRPSSSLCEFLRALACTLPLLACSRSEPPPEQTPPAPVASESFYGTVFEKRPDARTLTDLGRALFSDASLSASGRLACASCHDPRHAFGPANDLAVQLGGPRMTLAGMRAVPSLTYQQAVPPFSEHFNDTDGDDSVDQGPTGGRDWDGRASSAHEQATAPLLSPFEMANADRAAAVERLRRSPNAARFRASFGEHVLDHEGLAWNGLLMALEVFQQSPEEFYPYDSKYDAYLRGQARLDAAERRGLALFNDPAKGNCAQCHPSGVKRGAFPQFTDYGFIAIGVPRNREIPANADASYHDLGLCGPLRSDFAKEGGYCGLFRTPSLRNVALRRRFFHNGAMKSLEQVLDFYAERDTHPERFYPRARDGQVRKFDDLPEAYHENVNVEAPFDRQPGAKPALSKRERADIVAFLKTLTDGYALPKR